MLSIPVPSVLRPLLESPWLRPLNDRAAIDDLLALANPLWSLGAIRAVVVASRRETDRARTLTLRPNGWWPGHRAGQYVVATVEVRGRRLSRAFSLSSPPREDGLVEITVQRRDGGVVSAWWNDVAAEGDVVTLSGPSGDFVLPEAMPARIAMVSAGSGITPTMAMLLDLVARAARGGQVPRVTFVHAAPSRGRTIFGERLDAIAKDAPWLDLRVHCSAEGRRLRAEDFDRLAAEAGDAAAFACGPPAFVAAVAGSWSRAGNRGRLLVETFGAPRGDAEGQGGDVTAARSGVTFRASPGQSLLEAAEAAGLRPAHGCRAGICHTCRCRKLAGAVFDRRDGRLLREDGESIRLCVTTPVSDVTVEL